MFHLYFGAFDIVLYLGGTYFAMVLANAICDSLDQAASSQEVTTTTPATVMPSQTVTPHRVMPAAKRKEEVSVRVSVNS